MDKRLLRVGIGIAGKLHYYDIKDGFNIQVSGSKSTTPEQNTCDVSVGGLNRDTREYLLSSINPFIENNVKAFCTVDVGRESTGLFRLFEGDVIMAKPTQPPDIYIDFSLGTGFLVNSSVRSISFPGFHMLSEIVNSIGSELKLSVLMQARNKEINNFYVAGNGMTLVRRLSELGDVQAYIDNNTLIVKDRVEPLKGKVKILNKSSGMISIPEITENGVTVDYLIDGDSSVGGYLQIKSEINPIADGNYRIEKLDFSIDSHGDDFYYTAEALRLL